MKPAERIERVVALEEPDIVPFAPEIWVDHASKATGIAIDEICSSMGEADRAMEKLLAIYGELDMIYPLFMARPLGGQYRMSHDLPQYVEEELIGPELYDDLRQKGYSETYNPKGDVDAFERELKALRPYIQKWENVRGIPLYGGIVGINAPFESFSMLRSLIPISVDLFSRPDQIIRASDATIGDLIESRMRMAQMAGVPRIFYGAGRCSSSFISPKQYERFVHPYAKRMMERFAQAGYTIQMHMDGDWTPMFEYFKEFPRKKCILHLDGTSDIFKAKEVLGDRMCIMGDVFAPLLSFGSAHDVEEYCRKLIGICGEGGGFIMSAGCSLPMDARIENVQAMVKAVNAYGVYK